MLNMLKKLKVVLYLCLFSLALEGSQVDSLYQLLSTNSNDTSNISLYMQLGDATYRTNIDTAIYFWTKGRNLVEKVKDDYPKNARFRLFEADFNNSIGYCYKLIGDRAKGIAFYKTALKQYHLLYESLDSVLISQRISTSYNNIGATYLVMGDLEAAINSFHHALRIREQQKDTIGIIRTHVNLGNLNYNQSDVDQAEKHYKKAMSMASMVNDPRGLGLALNGLGAVYQSKESYSLALEMFLQNLDLRSQIGDEKGVATAYNNLGFVYSKLNKPEESLASFEKSLQKAKEVGDKNGEVYALKNIGSHYYTHKNLNKSLQILDKAYKLTEQIMDPGMVRDLSEELAKVNYDLGNYKVAFEYYEDFKIMSDSLMNEQNVKMLTKKEMQYDFEHQQKEQALVQKQRDFERDKELEMNKLYIRIGVGVSAVLLVFMFFILRAYKQKVKLNNAISVRNKEIQSQKSQIEEQHHLLSEKNKEIMDSIKYAQRLQSGFLHDPNAIQQAYEKSFVLYLPKDIVSGDFFWYKRIGNELIFSVIDCTGHGVPGAFLSLLGKQSLDKIILTQNIRETGAIFDALLKEVDSYFKNENTTEDLTYYDGMDASICKLNLETKELEFTGAKSNLYFVRNAEVVRVKGDNKGIGKGFETLMNFTTHQIQMQENDLIFLASDGYQDQFGGEKGKKFKIKKLNELFLQSKNKSVEEQLKLFIDTFENWKGNLEQVDDVTIIGVSV